ncbi:hypothetical protein EJ03DRAFT_279374, partial [Teratosphaeria nubilosa]
VTIPEYLRFYDLSWSQLHKSDLGLESYEDRTLYTTWNISLRQIRQRNELSAKLLELWCYFSNQDLWYEIICNGDAYRLQWLQELTASQSCGSQSRD